VLIEYISSVSRRFDFSLLPLQISSPNAPVQYFFTNTSSAWKYSISWIKIHENKALGPLRDLRHMFQNDLFSSFWTAKPTTLWTYDISPSFNCKNICNLILILLTSDAYLTQNFYFLINLHPLPASPPPIIYVANPWHGMLSTPRFMLLINVALVFNQSRHFVKTLLIFVYT
jgi:hypothetical protein